MKFKSKRTENQKTSSEKEESKDYLSQPRSLNEKTFKPFQQSIYSASIVLPYGV